MTIPSWRSKPARGHMCQAACHKVALNGPSGGIICREKQYPQSPLLVDRLNAKNPHAEVGEMITEARAQVANIQKTPVISERMRTAAFVTLELDWNQKIKDRAP